jgi:hypothetical protein
MMLRQIAVILPVIAEGAHRLDIVVPMNKYDQGIEYPMEPTPIQKYRGASVY